MATADEIASAGTYLSKNAGVEVTDGTQVRVTLGIISSTNDGSGAVNPIDYGLKVIAADGTTVIIDGTSDIFKIAASGSLSQACGAGLAANNTLDLTALTVSVTPALIGLCGFAGLSGSTRMVGPYITFGAIGGGAVPITFTCRLESSIAVPPNPRVTLSVINATAGALTGWGTYYVLQEVAI